MKVDEHSIQVQRTAHYYTLGEDINDAQHIWLLIHGYGQLASRMIEKFSNSDITSNYYIAPEALSKYYVKRQPNFVGSSWMTKEHRLDEITDYIGYLDQIMTPITSAMRDNQKLNILGFSQGTSTMWRWIEHCRFPFTSARYTINTSA
jgi:predicted esterase